SLPPLAGLVLVLALGIEVASRVVERWRVARLPAPAAGAPNVLLLVLDTVRSMSLGLYGYERPTTPALEAWARRGVVFERAYATAPWTLPSHGSMFTGRWPHELSTGWSSPLDRTHPTLAEALARRGYATGGFVANLLYCSRQHGLARGFARYDDFPVSPGEVLVSSSLGRFLTNRSRVRRLVGYYDVLGRKSAAEINRAFLGWIESVGDRPFFAFLNYYDAHEPYLPPDSLARRFASGGVRRPHRIAYQLHEASRSQRGAMTPEETRAERDAYDAAIAHLDAEIDRLFRELDRRGVLQRTLVIVTSDHGEHFGEHGLFGHGHRLYRPALEVPLVLIFPGRVPAGQRVREPVSLRDLPATTLALLGDSSSHRFPGASLTRFWGGDSLPVPQLILAEVDRGRRRYHVAAVAEGLYYIRKPGGVEEVYALEGDPLQLRNLAGDPGLAPLIDRIRARIPPGAIKDAD
ncbi:MAG TPA: sulfatase, partial [Gemmatimonadales bacterium]|nr:sulfatase [Gemmatimonadales bacterium]